MNAFFVMSLTRLDFKVTLGSTATALIIVFLFAGKFDNESAEGWLYSRNEIQYPAEQN